MPNAPCVECKDALHLLTSSRTIDQPSNPVKSPLPAEQKAQLPKPLPPSSLSKKLGLPLSIKLIGGSSMFTDSTLPPDTSTAKPSPHTGNPPAPSPVVH